MAASLERRGRKGMEDGKGRRAGEGTECSDGGESEMGKKGRLGRDGGQGKGGGKHFPKDQKLKKKRGGIHYGPLHEGPRPLT